MAQGRSNQQIAAALVLSVRTVERHVANIYDKIGASGRAARAAAASYALAVGVPEHGRWGSGARQMGCRHA